MCRILIKDRLDVLARDTQVAAEELNEGLCVFPASLECWYLRRGIGVDGYSNCKYALLRAFGVIMTVLNALPVKCPTAWAMVRVANMNTPGCSPIFSASLVIDITASCRCNSVIPHLYQPRYSLNVAKLAHTDQAHVRMWRPCLRTLEKALH